MVALMTAARGVAELRRESAGLDLEFSWTASTGRSQRDTVPSDRSGIGHLIVVHSVQRDFICGEAAAAGYEGKVRAHAELKRRIAGKQAQCEGIAAVQGKFQNLLVPDHLAERRGFGFERFGDRLDLYRLVDFARLQSDVDTQGLVHLNRHAGNGAGLEARELDRDGVRADGKEGDQGFAAVVSGSSVYDTGVAVGDFDISALDGCAAAVDHGHVDFAAGDLGMQRPQGTKRSAEIARETNCTTSY